MMTASDISKHLNSMFANYDYKLNNSFVFNWECDFFCRSTAGYFVEVEIKVSRSDYFKDFEKGKHKVFKDLVAGKKISPYKTGYNDRGDIAVKNFPNIRIECKGYRQSYANNQKRIVNGSEELIEENYYRGRGSDSNKKRFIVNDWQGRLEIRKHYTKDLYFPATSIGYHKLEEMHIPNQIYYAVPEGLIKLSELPSYAGLIEISHCAIQVKKAPYMHKRKLDLDRILLKKFYNLWLYKGKYIDEPDKVA